MEKALILSADFWSMTDEKTGEVIKGWSCWYVNDYREDAEKSFGYKPTKVTITDELAADLRGMKLPALCELGFGSRPGAGGKATLTLTGVKAIRSISFAEMQNPHPATVAKATA